MAQDRREDKPEERPADAQAGRARQAWKRPSLTSYGPIGKLTQGGTGAKADTTSGKRATCL